MIASSPAISRELWICSPRGLFRFFRLADAGLVELDRDGRALPVDASFSRKRENSGTGKKPAVTGGKVSVAPGPEATMRVPTVTVRDPVLAGGVSIEEGGLAGHREEEKT